MNQARITIKGTSYGLVIHIGPGSWDGLMAELATRLEQTASFFKGGRVALQVGPRQLEDHELEKIGVLLKSHQMTLWAVVGEAEETQQAAASLGLETQLALSRVSPATSEETDRTIIEEREAVLVRRTLRSGQSIHHSGHVIVIGDVNPGAEIIAGGDVLVWGKLRGTVHAGAGGDDGAIVCALGLAPTQLRISGYIARSPSGQMQDVMPEVASVQGGQIVVELWGTK
jgi:septum site-determining protein MinC